MTNQLLRHRLLAALVICLSGWVLLPFANLPTRLFGWSEFGGIYQIFSDDFEAGNMRSWSDGHLEGMEMQGWLDKGAPFTGRYRIDRSLLGRAGGGAVPVLTGFAIGLEPVFIVSVRDTEGLLEARIETRENDGDWVVTRWRSIAAETFRIEWRRAHPQTRDGALYLSVRGQLRLWLADLGNSSQELSSTGILEVEGEALLEPLDPMG